jgi:hypothetical protein
MKELGDRETKECTYSKMKNSCVNRPYELNTQIDGTVLNSTVLSSRIFVLNVHGIDYSVRH